MLALPSPIAWLLSRFLFDVIPLRLIPTIIVSTITYWMAGLAPDAAHFFKFLFILVLYTLAMTLFVSSSSSRSCLFFFARDFATAIFDHFFCLRLRIVISHQPLHGPASNFLHLLIYILSRCSRQYKTQFHLVQNSIFAYLDGKHNLDR